MVKNSIIDTHPSISSRWSDKNSLGPENYTAGSGAKVWLVCENHEEPYDQVLQSATRGIGCGFCSGKRVLKGFNDLQTLRPEIAERWSTENILQPDEIRPGDNRKMWFTCPHHQEPFTMRLNDASRRGLNCGFCSGRSILAGFNDLATTHPEIAKDWHPENEIAPTVVTSGSNKRVSWLCSRCSHVWRTAVSNRGKNGSGCPRCWAGNVSGIEETIRNSLHGSIKRIGRWTVDCIVGTSVIEYDGVYWHRNKQDLDALKTTELLRAGYRVLRIREYSDYLNLESLNITHPDYKEIHYHNKHQHPNLPDLLKDLTAWITPP